MQSPVEFESGHRNGNRLGSDATNRSSTSTDDAGVQSSAALELRGLSRSFGKQTALHALDLSVKNGEFLSILGPSGSGKTTTLNLIAGFDHPTSGAVLISSRDVTWKPSYDRDIGMVFQNYALFPHLSIFENVAFPLRSRGWPRQRIAGEVGNALQLVQLEDFAGRYPRELSGGQQQRVALARAVVYRPQLLLMDEPLGALDRKLRGEMQVEIKRIHRDLGATFVYVTHDQEEALSMSDRIAILNEGRLEQLGEPSTVYNRPATSFVSSFVGDVTFIDALFDRQSGTLSGPFIGKVELPRDRRPDFHGEVKIAVRPEHISLSKAGSPNDDSWRVQEVLFLGDAMSAFVRQDGKTIKCKIYTYNAFIPRAGDLVDINVDWDKVNIFPSSIE